MQNSSIIQSTETLLSVLEEFGQGGINGIGLGKLVHDQPHCVCVQRLSSGHRLRLAVHQSRRNGKNRPM